MQLIYLRPLFRREMEKPCVECVVAKADENASVSRDEVERLKEELKQSEVDKEFVWSLWKETQQELPDVCAIIEMVMEKEHQKYEEQRLILVQELKEKECYIASLLGSKRPHPSQPGTEEILRYQISKLELELKEKDDIIIDITQKLQSLSRYKEILKDKDREIELLKEEISSSRDKHATLSEKLMYCEKKLHEMKESSSLAEEEMNRMNVELEKSCEYWSNQFALQEVRTKFLHGQNKPPRKEMDSMKKVKNPLRSTSGASKGFALSGVREKGRSPNSHQITRMKKELSSMKALLAAKSEELKSLYSIHNRRLERMKVLKTSYDLTLKQLKTYDSKESPRYRKSSSEDIGALQHEDSERVWNELTQSRSFCNQLKKQLIMVEEERDTFQVQYLQSQTILTKLRTIDWQKSDDIEGKISAIAAVETASTENTKRMDDIGKLKCIIEKLKAENEHITQQSIAHSSECITLREEVERLTSLIAQKKETVDVSIMTIECKQTEMDAPILHQSSLKDASVMTDVINFTTLVDAAVQVNTGIINNEKNPISQKTNLDSKKGEFSSVKSFVLSCDKMPFKGSKKHRRAYSEGDCKKLDAFTRRNVAQSRSNVHFSLSSKKVITRGISTKLEKIAFKSTPAVLAHSSKDEIDKQKTPSGITGHKCVWQQQVKTLQQRLKSLGKQVTVLNASKRLLTHRLDEESSLRFTAENELQDTVKKSKGMKVTLEMLKNDKLRLLEEVKELQASISVLEGKFTHKTEADWKKMENQHKELQGKCSSLKSTIKSLETTLQMKSVELSNKNERCAKLERDIKQKRLLIEDHRSKQLEAKEALSDGETKINQFMENMQTLTVTVEQDKQKIKYLRAQLSKIAGDKEETEKSLRMANEEIQKLRALHENELKSKNMLSHIKLEFETHIESQLKKYQEDTMRMQAKNVHLKEIINEFKRFVMNVSDSLASVFNEEQLKCNESLYVHDPETDALAGRVREIAQSALNLSELELDEFFSDERSIDHMLSDVNQERHKSFQNDIRMKMSSELKIPFADDLVRIFSDYVVINVCE